VTDQPADRSSPASTSRSERLTATVHGRVQGVGFRWFVDRAASRLGLTGWVANQSDGVVQVVAEGPGRQLDELVGVLRSGPAGARVERVEEHRGPATHEFSRFHIRAGSHSGD
jgi:acylphosphatase